jgi:HK97 family phage prohead protease
MGVKYDFGGYATKNDLRCSDGRTIRKDAFKDNDGQTVPLVWQHSHNDPENVIGHALLENREDGVYCYGSFNSTSKAATAKALVEHGDITALSIYANKLKQQGGDVLHGVIREVSLVLAGANPGASIDFPILAHSGEESETEATIYTGEPLYLKHEEEQEEPEPEKEEPEEEKVEEELSHEDAKEEEPKEEKKMADEKTVKDVFDELTEEQKNVVYFMIGQALEDAGVEAEGEEDEDMKHNVFDTDERQDNYLSHEDMDMIFADAKRLGSLRDSVIMHMEDGVLAHSIPTEGMDGPSPTTAGQTYGFRDPDMLFPEYKSMNNPPEWIKRETGWVQKVMGGAHHTPFSRIKSVFADITEDEARAKGYIKGHLKKEQVFTLLKRTTDPQTIYKKQKLDRDDVIDITDFDVVAWIRGEMRVMLDEEIARAILIGDGRQTDSDDKIQEAHIRPIVNDAPLFSVPVNVPAGTDDAKTAKNFIDAAIRGRKSYKGSGTPTLFTTADVHTEMLLLEDQMGHKLYKSDTELATALRVKEIVEVEVMEGQQVNNKDLLGIIVNMADYNIGADKGGEINMFDDFDIDYNQMKYLIETRCSGALIKPFSALVLTKGAAQSGNDGE